MASFAPPSLLETLLPADLLPALQQPDPSPRAVDGACAHLLTTYHTITPFVPSPVLAAQNQPDPQRITGQYLIGTVVFADLSGFTALSGQLATAGRGGSEETSAIVNQVFDALLREVAVYGGGLLKFSGDAITVWFDAAQLGDHHALYACAAAHAMQRRMNDFAALHTSKGVFRLRLRVALHSGQVLIAEVGDHTHTELIATGRTINHVMIAADHAAPDEIVLSSHTLASLHGALTTPKHNDLHVLRSLAPVAAPRHSTPVWQPAAPSVSTLHALLHRIELLQPYLPLSSRFVFTPADSGEFRPVTAWFANFYEFNKTLTLLDCQVIGRDPTLVGSVLNTSYTRLQAIVHRYGGMINKVDMTPGGDRVMAVFGAPTAHEDDQARAVGAALALRSEHPAIDRELAEIIRARTNMQPDHHEFLHFLQQPSPQRVGIASGSVFAGIVGVPQRHEYTVMGETVNLAARLFTAANDGDVLINEGTQRAIQRRVHTQTLAPLALKGFAQPVPVFRAIAPHTATAASAIVKRHTAPLIGRDRELAYLLQTAEGVLRETTGGRIVALLGEPGIGKTRLVDEALHTLATTHPSCRTVRDTCLSHEQAVPYAVIGRLLHHLLDLPADADRATQTQVAHEQIQSLLGEWSRFAPLLGPVLHLPFAQSDLINALTPEQQHDRLHDVIALLFGAAAQRHGLVLTIDHLQWIDASSHELITRIAQEIPDHRLLLLLVYRPATSFAEPWRTLAHTHMMPVGELAPMQSELLLRTLLGDEPPAEVYGVIERTNGTPFFLEEMVRYLLESNTLQRGVDGSWELTRPLDGQTCPDQVEQLLVARLDRLSNDARGLLHILAVIGQRLDEPLMRAASPHPDRVDEQLRELIEAALLVSDTADTHRNYRFKHALIRDVAYNNLLYARRRALHLRIATVIEEQYTADRDHDTVVLAQHFLHSEHWARALPYFVQAAQQAQARYANKESLTLYQQALAIAPWSRHDDVIPDPTLATTLYEGIGDVQTLIGEYAAARATYLDLLKLLAQSSGADHLIEQAALQRKIGSTYEHQGDLEAALQQFGKANALIHVADHTNAVALEHARLLSDTGWIHFRQHALEMAQQHLEQALTLLEPLAAYDEQARIHNRLGGVVWERGDIASAQRYVELSLEASVRSANLAGQAKALNNLGLLAEQQGRMDDSINYSSQALEINKRIGNARDTAIAAINVGWVWYGCEAYDQARTYFDQGATYAASVHDSYHQMLALLGMGHVLTTLRDFDAAIDAIERSLAFSVELDLPTQQLEGHVMLAEIALQRKEITEAVDHYKRALPLATDHESEEYAKFQRLAAEIAIAHGDSAHAITLLTANHALFTQLQNAREAERSQNLLTTLTHQIA